MGRGATRRGPARRQAAPILRRLSFLRPRSRHTPSPIFSGYRPRGRRPQQDQAPHGAQVGERVHQAAGQGERKERKERAGETRAARPARRRRLGSGPPVVVKLGFGCRSAHPAAQMCRRAVLLGRRAPHLRRSMRPPTPRPWAPFACDRAPSALRSQPRPPLPLSPFLTPRACPPSASPPLL
jgi:hypothetical protein